MQPAPGRTARRTPARTAQRRRPVPRSKYPAALRTPAPRSHRSRWLARWRSCPRSTPSPRSAPPRLALAATQCLALPRLTSSPVRFPHVPPRRSRRRTGSDNVRLEWCSWLPPFFEYQKSNLAFEILPMSKKSRRLPSKSLRAACGVDVALVHGQLAARIGISVRQALPADHFRCPRQGDLSVAAADTDNRVRLRRGMHEARIVRSIAYVKIDQSGFDAELLAFLNCEHGIDRVIAAVDPKHERALGAQQARQLRRGAAHSLLLLPFGSEVVEQDAADEVNAFAMRLIQIAHGLIVLVPVSRAIGLTPAHQSPIEYLIRMYERPQRQLDLGTVDVIRLGVIQAGHTGQLRRARRQLKCFHLVRQLLRRGPGQISGYLEARQRSRPIVVFGFTRPAQHVLRVH